MAKIRLPKGSGKRLKVREKSVVSQGMLKWILSGNPVGVPSIYYNIVFSQTFGPIELKFHVKTLYDKLAKIYAKYFGHLTKTAATPIYGKKHLKIFFSRTRRLMTLGLGM